MPEKGLDEVSNNSPFGVILNQEFLGAFAPGHLSPGAVETAISGEVIVGSKKFFI
jgi:hypothetical protein